MEITFQIDESFVADINNRSIQNAIRTTVRLFSGSDLLAGSIAINITNNNTVAQLNHQYRDINAPTDVLSFRNSPDPDFPDATSAMRRHLGDIVIAYPVAKTQAAAGGHTPMDEVILLAVHGTLHLLGFDHDTPQQKDKMWAAQQQVMAKLGLAHIQPTES